MVERLIIYGLGTGEYTDLFARYKLVCTSKEAPAPTVKTRYVELPGSNIPADLSNGNHKSQRSFELSLARSITTPASDFMRDLIIDLHSKVFTFAFLSMPTKEFTGRFVLSDYDVRGNYFTTTLTIYVHTAITVSPPAWVDELTPSTREEEVEKERETEAEIKEQAYENEHWLPDITEEIYLSKKVSQVLNGAEPDMHVIHNRFDIVQIHLQETISVEHSIVDASSSYMINIRSWYAGWIPYIELYRKTRKSDGKKFYYRRGPGYPDGFWQSLDGERHVHVPTSSMVYNYPMTARSDGDTTGLYGWSDQRSGNFGSNELAIVEEMCRLNDTLRSDARAWEHEASLGPLREQARYEQGESFASIFLDCSQHGADQGYAYEGYVAMPFDQRQVGVQGDWFIALAFNEPEYEDYVIRLADLSMIDTLKTLRNPVKPGYTMKGTYENPVLIDPETPDYLVLSNYYPRILWPHYGDKNYLPTPAARRWYMRATAEKVYPRFEFVQATRLSDGKIYRGQDAIDAGFAGVFNSIWDMLYVNDPGFGTWLDNDLLVGINQGAEPYLYLEEGMHAALSYFHHIDAVPSGWSQSDWTDAVYKVTGAYEK